MNIKLDLNGCKKLAKGHPWVRREDLNRFATPPKAGELVRLQDSLGNFLAHAVSEGPQAAIPYRVISRSRHPDFNAAYFDAVVEQALARRGPSPRVLGENLTRLVHGEADGLPGVFCDRVGDTLLIDYHSAGLLAYAELIEAALLKQTRHKNLWKRAFGAWENVLGNARSGTLISERAGIKSAVRLELEDSYDFPLECSADMERLRGLNVKGEALALFSRHGAWPAALAFAGAKKVLCLDRDAAASKRAAESLGLNRFAQGMFEFEGGDAFAKLDKLKGKRRFSAIMIDAPTQSKSAHGRFNAKTQLDTLVERALALAEPGALLLASVRYSTISQATFLGSLNQGAAEAGLKLETVAQHKAPADCPELEGFAEAQGRLWQACRVI